MSAHTGADPQPPSRPAAITAARIAGLAVAIGVGLALASGQGTAYADSGSATTESSAASAPSEKPDKSDDAGKKDEAGENGEAGKDSEADRSDDAGPTEATPSRPGAAHDEPSDPEQASTVKEDDDADPAPEPTKRTRHSDEAAAPDTAEPATATTKSQQADDVVAAVPVAAIEPAPIPSARVAAPVLPAPPAPSAEAMLAWARRELHTAFTRPWPDSPLTTAVAVLRERMTDLFNGVSHVRPTPIPTPTAGDMVETPFGDIGKWMVQPSGQISDWLGQKYWNKNLLEPVNVVIVDRTSTTPEESTAKVIAALTEAGFPARTVHSTGYRGLIDGVLYDQEPTGAQEAFSNCFYLFPNDHARFFGPAPAPDGVGYVWTAALSRERLGIYDWKFTHRYVSFNRARNTLRDSLVRTGATDLGLVDLNNDVHTRSLTTGDHDGYATVVELD